MKELHRLPSEVQAAVPDLTLSQVYQCFALQNVERKAIDEAMKDT